MSKDNMNDNLNDNLITMITRIDIIKKVRVNGGYQQYILKIVKSLESLTSIDNNQFVFLYNLSKFNSTRYNIKIWCRIIQ